MNGLTNGREKRYFTSKGNSHVTTGAGDKLFSRTIRFFEQCLRELQLVVQSIELKRQMERQSGFNCSACPSLWSGIGEIGIPGRQDDALVLKILGEAGSTDCTE